MRVRFAFAGLRHGHILMVHSALKSHPDAEIVAVAEEDEKTRMIFQAGNDVRLTHNSFERMLDEVDCDVVAVGQHYAGRGALIRMALERGRHVLADKPLCCTMSDYEAIERLAREKRLSVIAQLDLRGDGRFRAMRKLIRSGEIGEVHAISFGGQHPLMYGQGRPDWYFEPGLHGGIFPDIAIHAVDFIPWLTGRSFAFVEAARAWNAGFRKAPLFQNAGQAMLTLDNNAGVLGDVSYFAPNSFGYGTPYYWRTTIWGQGGVLETSCTQADITFHKQGNKEAVQFPPEPAIQLPYLSRIISDVRGEAIGEPDTHDCLVATRISIMIQLSADQSKYHVSLQ